MELPIPWYSTATLHSTYYNIPKHYTTKCLVPIIYKNCNSLGHKAIKCIHFLYYYRKPKYNINIYWWPIQVWGYLGKEKKRKRGKEEKKEEKEGEEGAHMKKE